MNLGNALVTEDGFGDTGIRGEVIRNRSPEIAIQYENLRPTDHEKDERHQFRILNQLRQILSTTEE